MNFLLITLTLLLSATVAAGQSDPQKETPDLPNIIFIILDAARADHFSCYGYNKLTTPQIDQIANKGVIFLKNFSPATETFNSMPLIMSSRYFSKEIFQKDDWRWGLRRESAKTIFTDFDQEQIFLPDLLSQNNYHTGIIHDHWWFVPQTDFIQSFDEAIQVKGTQPTDEEILAQVCSWIKKNQDQPFFLYLHIMSPHQPYPPKPEDEEFLQNYPESLVAKVRDKFKNKPNESCHGWNPEEISCLKALYDSNLRHTDTKIGELYAILKKWKLADNTLFIITSDHGEHLGQHNLLNHSGQPFDSVTHVPLIMVWPQGLPSGIKVQGLTETIDIMPSIAKLCSLQIPPGKTMDGISLIPYICNPHTGKKAVYTDQSIRTQTFKYIIDTDGSILFDVIHDPLEKIYVNSIYPKIPNFLENQHQVALGPSLLRYRQAKKTAPPSYPFYLPLREFRLSPPESFESCNLVQPPEQVLSEISPTHQWILNLSMHHGGLFFLPELGPPSSLKISIKIPSGNYYIAVLVEHLDKAHGEKAKKAIRLRFHNQDSFLAPCSIEEISEPRFRYFNWGTIAVTDNCFQTELSGTPGNNTPLYIHHIRFIPEGKLKMKDHQKINKDDHKKHIDGLRSLGYL